MINIKKGSASARRRSRDGFTLIETILYVALLSLMLSGAIMTTYQLTKSSTDVSQKSTTLREELFEMRKSYVE